MSETKEKRVRAGKKRVTLERIAAFGMNLGVQFDVSVRDAETGDPIATSFWYKNEVGRNIDLAKGSDVSFTITIKGLGRASLRAWRNHERDMIIRYTMTPVSPTGN